MTNEKHCENIGVLKSDCALRQFLSLKKNREIASVSGEDSNWHQIRHIIGSSPDSRFQRTVKSE